MFITAILGTVIGVQPIGTPPNDERIYTIIVRRIYKVCSPTLSVLYLSSGVILLQMVF